MTGRSLSGVAVRPRGLPLRVKESGDTARAPRSASLRRRLVQFGIAAAATATVAVGAFFFLIRDWSAFGVEKVEIRGLPAGPDRGTIEERLSNAARGMTVFHVDETALRSAVVGFPTVADLTASGDFPDGITIALAKRRATASVRTSGGMVTVADDGAVIGPTQAVRPKADASPLPTITAAGQVTAGRLEGAEALAILRTLAHAPAQMLSRVRDVSMGEHGMTLSIPTVPPVYFGGSDRLDDKWASLVRLLRETETASAAYIDLSVPERPALGGLVQVAPSVAEPTAEPAESQVQVESVPTFDER